MQACIPNRYTLGVIKQRFRSDLLIAVALASGIATNLLLVNEAFAEAPPPPKPLGTESPINVRGQTRDAGGGAKGTELSRTPYVYTVQGGTCDETDFCWATFPKVRRNQRLEVKKVSCQVSATDNGSAIWAYLEYQTRSEEWIFVPLSSIWQRVIDTTVYQTFTDTVDFYVPHGTYLYWVQQYTNSPSTSVCTIGGDLVTLQD